MIYQYRILPLWHRQPRIAVLPEYKGLELSAAKTEVTDELVDSYIDYMLTQYPVYEEVTGRAVDLGDIVNIDEMVYCEY